MEEKSKLKDIKTDKIKGLLKSKGLYYKDVANKMNVTENSMTNKMQKGNITAAELVALAEAAGTYIAFVDKETNEIVEKLHTYDIKTPKAKNNNVVEFRPSNTGS